MFWVVLFPLFWLVCRPWQVTAKVGNLTFCSQIVKI